MKNQPNRLFDAYLAIDWSSRNTPSSEKPTKDAIWVGEAFEDDAGKHQVRESYWRTRHACVQYLRKRLKELTDKEQRVFIGFDFAYGYPTGYAESLGLTDDAAAPWKRIWNELGTLIQDSEENVSNRFKVASAFNRRCGGQQPGPLWGCPPRTSHECLTPTSPTFPYVTKSGTTLERLRWVDRGEPKIQPIWKLCYTASVGSQVLVGIPAVRSLREDPELSAVSAVWPFETGFTSIPTPSTGPFILHVEIWPGLVPRALDPAIVIKDQAQVRAVVEWLYNLDTSGTLGKFFDVPPHLPPEGIDAAMREEGCIIGAGHRKARGK